MVVANRALVRDHNRLMPLSDWRALFVDQVTAENLAFTITLTFEPTDPVHVLVVQVKCARNEQLRLHVKVRARALDDEVVLQQRSVRMAGQKITDYLAVHAPLAVFVPPFYGTVLAEEHRPRVVIDRLLGSGDQSHVVRNLIAGLATDQFDQLNSFLDDTLGAKLTYRTSGDALQSESPMLVRFRDTNGEIELSAAGAGLVNLVSLFAALSRWRHASANRTVLFLIDEPEAHLHPRLQAESAERLGRLVTREFRAQMLLATHSVDILNRLAEAGAQLLRCDRGAEPSVVELSSDSALFQDVASWADLTPYTAINFLASRRVAFCEGDDEIALLPRLAELHLRNDPARLRDFRRWALVRLEGASNHALAGLLSRLVRSEVVSVGRKAGAPALQVVVVLDRDCSRPPGITRRAVESVDETTVVWERHSLESVLLDPPALARWIRAFAERDAPADLEEVIRGALAAADADPELNERAFEQVLAAIHRTELKDEAGRVLGGEQKTVHASRRARALVKESPETWQRGKDRSRFVLGRVRESIALPMRNQFPSDVIQLVVRAPLHRIGDAAAALPAEVVRLIELLVPRT